MKTSATINQDELEEKLGTALAEHIIERLGDEADDREMQGYVLHDINDLLLTTGTGAFLTSGDLCSPQRLHSYLKASMMVPAQMLAKVLPNRTAAWMRAEPPPGSEDRGGWVEEGRSLLDKTR